MCPVPVDWLPRHFDSIAERSVVIHGNRAVLPVAAWILEADVGVASAGEITRGLHGQIAPNKALEALARLSAIGALEELPHPGRPHPRMFAKKTAAYWGFVAEEVAEAKVAHGVEESEVQEA